MDDVSLISNKKKEGKTSKVTEEVSKVSEMLNAAKLNTNDGKRDDKVKKPAVAPENEKNFPEEILVSDDDKNTNKKKETEVG